MKFQNTSVMNFGGAFRGLRNPLESWAKSDSVFGLADYTEDAGLEEVAYAWVNQENSLREAEKKEPYGEMSDDFYRVLDKYMDWLSGAGTLRVEGDAVDTAYIGPKDMCLAQRMIKAGSSDRKFLRQIMICVDITGPLYWWKEFDTYKVGTVANSTSTMHKLASTPITIDCFEMNDCSEDLMIYENSPFGPDMDIKNYWNMLIVDLETLRTKYNETKDQRYWKELIRLLPESWLQTRTVTMNYQILRNIYSQRKHHRLTEWHSFCDWIKSLPYAGELILHGLD